MSQGFQVHPLSERLPQFAPRCRSGAVTGSDEPGFSCGFRGLAVEALVLQLLAGALRLTLRLNIEDTQWSVLAAEGPGSSCVVPLELLDDGRELGVQGWSASFGSRGRLRGVSAGVLLLLVWRRRMRMMKRGRKGRSGRTGGRRSIGHPVSRRGRGSPLLVADGCRAGVVVWAWTGGGGFALGQNTLLYHHWLRSLKQRGPVRDIRLLLRTNQVVTIGLLDLVVDNICDALKLARWIYTCEKQNE